jgi:hypothetical protein
MTEYLTTSPYRNQKENWHMNILLLINWFDIIKQSHCSDEGSNHAASLDTSHSWHQLIC